MIYLLLDNMIVQMIRIYYIRYILKNQCLKIKSLQTAALLRADSKALSLKIIY